MAEPTDGRKARNAAPPPPVVPVAPESPAALAGAADDITPANAFAEEKLADLERQLAAAKAEAAAHAAEVERLKAAPAGFATGPGKRFRVEIPDGPAWVVEPAPGEHPFEAFKRATGVLGSVHAPVIAEVPAETPVGKA